MGNIIKKANRIFLSYRRADSQNETDQIYKALVADFGSNCVFRDMESIPLGVNFKDHIDSVISTCDVVIIIIGDKWKGEINSKRGSRLDDPNDFVRLEVEAALQRNIPVIPVLIRNTQMPEEKSIPSSLQVLRFRNAVSLSSNSNGLIQDPIRLLNSIKEHLVKADEPFVLSGAAKWLYISVLLLVGWAVSQLIEAFFNSYLKEQPQLIQLLIRVIFILLIFLLGNKLAYPVGKMIAFFRKPK